MTTRNIPAPLATHLGETVTKLATLWKITRTDGVVLGFTDHDRDITANIDGLGSVTYRAADSFRRSAMEGRDDLAVATSEMETVISSSAISETDLIGGRYDNAEVKIAFVNWSSPSSGAVKYERGWLGEVVRRDYEFSTELRSLAQKFNKNIGSVYGPKCRSPYGDTGSGPSRGCRFPVNPSVWTANTTYPIGSVVRPSVANGLHFIVIDEPGSPARSGVSEPVWPTVVGGTVLDGSITWRARLATQVTATIVAVTSRNNFRVQTSREFTFGRGGTKSGGFFALGRVTIAGGSPSSIGNEGLAREILSFENFGAGSPTQFYTITTFAPFPFDLVVGTAVTLRAGCNLTVPVCRDNYDNLNNFRGEAYLPGDDKVFTIHRNQGGGSKF